MRRARFYILVLGLTLLPQVVAASDLVRWLAAQDQVALGLSVPGVLLALNLPMLAEIFRRKKKARLPRFIAAAVQMPWTAFWLGSLFYAILRAFTADVWVVQLVNFLSFGIIDAKFFGVLAMFGAILVMALVPWLDTSRVRSGRFRPQFKWWFWLLAVDFVVLTWVGAQPAEGIYPYISLIGAAYWFAYFLVILPLLGVIERPAPMPTTIEQDFDEHYRPSAAHPAE